MRIERTKKQRRIFANAARRPAGAECAPVLAVLMVFCLLFNLAIATGQQPGNTVTGFKAPLDYFEPPHERQMKSYLEGSRSELGPNGAIIWDAKLQTFHEDGTHEMIVSAPQCFYDYNKHVVNSTGSLQVQTWDDKNKRALHLQGSNGFYWQQTNSFLIVSNQQSTIISGSATNSFTP